MASLSRRVGIVSEIPRETPGDAVREPLPVPDSEPCAPLAVRVLPIGLTAVLPSVVPVGGPEGAVPAFPGGVELCMAVLFGVGNGGNERDVSLAVLSRFAWCCVV